MTDAELVERARALLTEEPDARRFSREKLHAVIPVAIAELQLKIEEAAQVGVMGKFNSFVIETDDIDIDSGIADLEDAVNETGLRLDMHKSWNVFISYAENPKIKTVQMVNSYDRLSLGGIQDRFYVLAFLDGNKMYFRDPSAASNEDATTKLSATVTIRGVATPTTTEQISKDQEGILAGVLAEVARREVPLPEIGVNLAP